jgi:hypothetical protein
MSFVVDFEHLPVLLCQFCLLTCSVSSRLLRFRWLGMQSLLRIQDNTICSIPTLSLAPPTVTLYKDTIAVPFGAPWSLYCSSICSIHLDIHHLPIVDTMENSPSKINVALEAPILTHILKAITDLSNATKASEARHAARLSALEAQISTLIDAVQAFANYLSDTDSTSSDASDPQESHEADADALGHTSSHDVHSHGFDELGPHDAKLPSLSTTGAGLSYSYISGARRSNDMRANNHRLSSMTTRDSQAAVPYPIVATFGNELAIIPYQHAGMKRQRTKEGFLVRDHARQVADNKQKHNHKKHETLFVGLEESTSPESIDEDHRARSESPFDRIQVMPVASALDNPRPLSAPQRPVTRYTR